MVFDVLPLFPPGVLGVRTTAIGLIEGVAEAVSSFLEGRVRVSLGSRRASKRARGRRLRNLRRSRNRSSFSRVSWGAVLGIRSLDRFGKGVRSAPRDALLAESVSTSVRAVSLSDLHRAFDSAGAVVRAPDRARRGLVGPEGSSRPRSRNVPAPRPREPHSRVRRGRGPRARREGNRRLVGEGRDSSAALASRARPALSAVPPRRRALHARQLLRLVSRSQGVRTGSLGRRESSGCSSAFNVVYTAVSAPAGRLSDRLGRKRVIAAGWLFYALLYLGFALAREASHVVALFVMYGDLLRARRGRRARVRGRPGSRSGKPRKRLRPLSRRRRRRCTAREPRRGNSLARTAFSGPKAPFFFGASPRARGDVLLLTVKPADACAILNRVSSFRYQPIFELGEDDTPYRKLTSDGVGEAEVLGRNALVVEPEALSLLASQAVRDVSHLFRTSHLEQVRKILDDPEASDNDRFVALQMLKNANVSAGMILPSCQDTGTAIVFGARASTCSREGATRKRSRGESSRPTPGRTSGTRRWRLSRCTRRKTPGPTFRRRSRSTPARATSITFSSSPRVADRRTRAISIRRRRAILNPGDARGLHREQDEEPSGPRPVLRTIWWWSSAGRRRR